MPIFNQPRLIDLRKNLIALKVIQCAQIGMFPFMKKRSLNLILNRSLFFSLKPRFSQLIFPIFSLLLSSCAQLEKLMVSHHEIVKKDNCIVIIPDQLLVCENDDKIHVIRDKIITSWPQKNFKELLTRKVQVGLLKNNIQIGRVNELTLSVFSHALDTQKIEWFVEFVDETMSYGFTFPENPSEWREQPPVWAKHLKGNYQEPFTGRLLIQWSDSKIGMPDHLWKELFPQFRVVQMQGSVWELAIPVSAWQEFQETILEDDWTSKRFASVKVIPYSVPFGRKREIAEWIWKGGGEK